ncbi:hypothetical protein SAY87_012969 [Trapa incisa]|uniref:AT1G08220-like protein n=1 Tax=Trapa incisa TaxID=236973 RepID=A0AAN7QC62_9MYRT|nr:hypothetical protein SAY87_012969 [Trapa incisa]
MLRLNRLLQRCCLNNGPSILTNRLSNYGEELAPHPPERSAQRTSKRFFDIYQAIFRFHRNFSRKDEMNRGYFADMSELKQHGGKIAMANKVIIPAMAAVKFPNLEVTRSDGRSFKLPISCKENTAIGGMPTIPKVSLVCLSFRASSQAMVDSWSLPFSSAFNNPKDGHLYEVSFIDSWLLCRSPIKQILLRVLRKKTHDGGKDALERQILYSFGDHYYFRKELKVLNLLTGYIFLVDKFGRIRWQGFGLASEEEVSSLISCTSLLLEEE